MSNLARFPLVAGVLLLGAIGFACGSDKKVVYVSVPPDAGPLEPAACALDEECPVEGETCDVAAATCVPIGDGSEIGTGDGTPGSVKLTTIYTAEKGAAVQLVDVQFNGDDPTEAWAIGYGNDSVHVGKGISETSPGTWEEIIDPAAVHFMHKPPAFAWGANGFWGICGDNDNAQNDPRLLGNYFMGPALFTSDLSVFAKPTPGGLGSHYDMLHNTSMCRGIAHVERNVFWVFNGELGALERYNFNKPHGPGEDDHSDGEIYRYAVEQVKGVDGVSSHVFYDPADRFLYVADTGNARIVRLDTTKGTEGKELPRKNEILKKGVVMNGTAVEEVVAPGFLTHPSGLEVRRGVIYVTDAATGAFYAFDKSGNPLRSLDTGLGRGALSGFTFGPDGKIWLTDRKQGNVLRLDAL
ncbi:MAG: hypothetical protein KIT84_19020 [Labilithrix sp.]|nr:hypothetical protein [Labilithrix sp.]MCW5813127.1 hypothetical protein [Labilithrix sp.]